MFPLIAAVFLVVPVLEIFLLIQVGSVIGAWWTVALVVLTAIIGVQLLKYQGLSTFARAQEKMQSGHLPAREMFEGVALIVAGAFLLTPGFFTDGFGFCLLMPPLRRWLVSSLIDQMVKSGRFVQYPAGEAGDTDVIEGVRYRRED